MLKSSTGSAFSFLLCCENLKLGQHMQASALFIPRAHCTDKLLQALLLLAFSASAETALHAAQDAAVQSLPARDLRGSTDH